MMETLAFLSLLSFGFWLLLPLDRGRAWPRGHVLSCGAASDGADGVMQGGRVVAVVPARNEAEVLEETLGSLLSQDHVGLSVLLVDDGSEDGTGDLALAVAKCLDASSRLRVLGAPPRPPGWTGKLHALACGVASLAEGQGAPDWLLFTDADIRHHAGSLRALLGKAREGGFDLVSVMARLHAGSFWEKLLIPPFVYFFQLLYPFRRVSRPGSRVAAAAGGCILVRPSVLAAAGGLEAIRDAVIDDVSLARQVKRAGGRLWLGFDAGIASVRPYRSLGELWAMVARSAFTQLGYHYWLVPLVVAGLAVLFAAPPLLLAASLGTALVGGELGAGGALAIASSAGAWGLQAWALLPSVRHHRVAWGYAFTLPLSSLLYGAMTWSSAWDHLRGRGARWKGRAYSAGLSNEGEGEGA